MTAVSNHPVLDVLRRPWRQLWDRPPAGAPRPGLLARGRGQPALVFPTLGAGPDATSSLRRALDHAGFHCHDWGLGFDVGPRAGKLRQRLRQLEERVIDVFETEREPVTLVGWGLSGLYARELAKRAAPIVRQVITLGTPFNTAAGQCTLLATLHDDGGGLPPELAQQLRECPPVPCTSIYSLADELVPWPMCIAPDSACSEHVMVAGCAHRQLPDHRRVREVIADRLAQPPGDWRPFGR